MINAMNLAVKALINNIIIGKVEVTVIDDGSTPRERNRSRIGARSELVGLLLAKGTQRDVMSPLRSMVPVVHVHPHPRSDHSVYGKHYWTCRTYRFGRLLHYTALHQYTTDSTLRCSCTNYQFPQELKIR